MHQFIYPPISYSMCSDTLTGIGEVLETLLKNRKKNLKCFQYSINMPLACSQYIWLFFFMASHFIPRYIIYVECWYSHSLIVTNAIYITHSPTQLIIPLFLLINCHRCNLYHRLTFFTHIQTFITFIYLFIYTCILNILYPIFFKKWCVVVLDMYSILWSTDTPRIRRVPVSDTGHRYDTDTYNYIELCYFLKNLAVSEYRCPCRVVSVSVSVSVLHR
jgi:hypothetical protein